MQGSFEELQGKAQRLLMKYDKSLEELKKQLKFLLQKYTFMQYSKKLGFKLERTGRRKWENSDGVDANEFRHLVAECIKFCMERSHLSEHSVVTTVARVLQIRVSVVYYWAREADLS